MCGIVGYVGEKNAQEVILAGLHRLEYRGYDSAGLATVRENDLTCTRCVGKLGSLEGALRQCPHTGHVGIGHTRWATHGTPNETNAHPHLDGPGDIAVVHNGIIENFQELRRKLEDGGVSFRSETDTEVLPHLIHAHYEGDLFEAVKKALREVRGAYALGVVCRHEPDLLVAARKGSPLIVGLGDGEAFIASDVPAIMQFTREVIYLEEGDLCTIKRDGCAIQDLEGNERSHITATVDWDETTAEKEDYPHYMLKEIHQQPDVIRHQLLTYVDKQTGQVRLPDLGLDEVALCDISRIVIVACGTAWHAGMVGKYLIEGFARVPVEVELASEFRYGNRVLGPNDLVVPVTQSGETADTLEAIRIARQEGASVMGVVNVVGSSIAREADGVIYTEAGPEIGVASTKAYTSQISALVLFAIQLARTRRTISGEAARGLLKHLWDIPGKLTHYLESCETVRRVAEKPRYLKARNAMFIGRGYNYPSSMEGALKLKEISYIHVEGYAAGEMKHGPIALVTSELPVVCIAVQGQVYEKVVSNIQEIRARDGITLAIATEGDDLIREHSDDVLYVPDCYEPFSPILVAAPLQLLAYYIADGLGRDVDQPRNLAKSVTVE